MTLTSLVIMTKELDKEIYENLHMLECENMSMMKMIKMVHTMENQYPCLWVFNLYPTNSSQSNLSQLHMK